MSHSSRRSFLAGAGAVAALAAPEARAAAPAAHSTEAIPLDGPWLFRTDPEGRGELQGWHLAGNQTAGWSEVMVPHTWQVRAETADYQGAGWYRRVFDAPAAWASQAVRVEFEAVYHTATVWLNGRRVGQHVGKGYTAFECDLAGALRPGANVLVVRAENTPNKDMLPRELSFDWARDGGITRPVRLLVTPPVYIERVDVDAVPDPAMRQARLNVRVVVRNRGRAPAEVRAGYEVMEEPGGAAVLRRAPGTAVSVPAGGVREVALNDTLANPRLWHFDHPYLYRLAASIGGHGFETVFGVRSFEARGDGFYLNGERVRLMGVERMAGSHPDFGMAEPPEWIVHDHNDMKELNCVFTRVHWQQDRRVLDYCDRNGILIQVEVPAWGPKTFAGMKDQPDMALMENGLEQLREMIQRDRNHPSVVAWGLCNEVNGQNPVAKEFIRRMYEEARRLDPLRLRTYASNSLRKTPERDASAMMDFVSWNEYWESWSPGTVADMTRNLEEIHRAFPEKPIVVSEYGLCECNPKNPTGDPRRIQILREHTAVMRERPYVGGAIFFCYNDYRTHIGDKGVGALRQRVHGVVDLFGDRKASFEALRAESSPVEVTAKRGDGLVVTVRARRGLPAYTLVDYTVRCTVYGYGGLPMERVEAPLAPLAPGQQATVRLALQYDKPQRLRVDVVRPTGFSAASWEGS